MASEPKKSDSSEEAVDGASAKVEVESRLNKLLAKALSDERPSFLDKLNSPFIITIIGGILLGTFGSYIQYRISETQRAEAERSARASRKEKLAYDFADKFPSTLSLADRFKERELWLVKTSYDSKDRFKDGRNFDDTRVAYESLLDRYLEQKPTASLCNEIVSSFPSPDTFNYASNLNMQVELLLNATNLDQVVQAYDGANASYQSLTKTVFDQLNNPQSPPPK